MQAWSGSGRRWRTRRAVSLFLSLSLSWYGPNCSKQKAPHAHLQRAAKGTPNCTQRLPNALHALHLLSLSLSTRSLQKWLCESITGERCRRRMRCGRWRRGYGMGACPPSSRAARLPAGCRQTDRHKLGEVDRIVRHCPTRTRWRVTGRNITRFPGRPHIQFYTKNQLSVIFKSLAIQTTFYKYCCT